MSLNADGARVPTMLDLLATGYVYAALQERLPEAFVEGYPKPGATNTIFVPCGELAAYHRIRLTVTVEPDPDNEPF